jgi:hypothetical protein
MTLLAKDLYHMGTLSSQRIPMRTFQASFPVQIDSDFFTCKAAGVIPYRTDPVTGRVQFLFHTFHQEENQYRGAYTDFGGKVEVVDVSPKETALREFFEESRYMYGWSLKDVPMLVQQYYGQFCYQSRIFLYNHNSKYMVYFWRMPEELWPKTLYLPEIHCHWVSEDDILCDLDFQSRVHFRIRHFHLKRKVLQIAHEEHGSHSPAPFRGSPPGYHAPFYHPPPSYWCRLSARSSPALETEASEAAPSPRPSTPSDSSDPSRGRDSTSESSR